MNQEHQLWKALADPTRRAILDMLRDAPKTTGTIAEGFKMSRYGIMKHLSVLEDADLVLVRREGRERFNHLNAVPLEKLHARWVHQWAARDAQSLLSLESHLNKDEEMTNNNSHSFHIEQKITLNAGKEKVWAALTKDIGSWWGLHIGPTDSKITLDGRVGGQFIERWGDGEGELYATVTHLRIGEKITLEGAMGMGGPGYSKFSYTLTEAGDSTEVLLTHYCHGLKDEETAGKYTEGWSMLLNTFLPAWVHDGKTEQEVSAAMQQSQ